MKHLTITLCEVCSSPVSGPGIRKPVHGVTIELGFSIGGWGHRQNHIQWSGEVCEKCFHEYNKIAHATQAWLEKRDGCRAPEIVITEHDVSTVPADQSSPDGRPGTLLR